MAPITLTQSSDGNAEALRSSANSENAWLLSLSAPGAAVIFLAVILPLGVMLYFSFLGDRGGFSLENYQRLWSQPVYAEVLAITFRVSLYTTLLVALIGYPLTYFMVQLPEKTLKYMLLFILLPFWTAVLVRTYAWVVLLQNKGLVNKALIGIGLISEPLQLAHNLTGALIGMVHVMIPFMVLPLYASMRSIDQNLVAAACNLGAKPSRAFWDVFFPLSLPGFFSGLLMVFVMCLGFYTTPAVLGGGQVVMAAMRIDANVRLYSSWGAASSLGIVLLTSTMTLIAIAAVLARKTGRRTL
ncbi:ABC transporter permease [Bradyrhizobium sp. SSUT18]|uniref:ABC transporter permease n=1 Tax=Bradyrhizobium sp. SSUT18 TaxID=3040602 RepID=UPI00244B9573|nr:ABC transporter permease [Bradyrhizobium sp. SSUT18]MDH2398383.1 ABC transporter permease [Bradyrhizobium sp. SSUT18]